MVSDALPHDLRDRIANALDDLLLPYTGRIKVVTTGIVRIQLDEFDTLYHELIKIIDDEWKGFSNLSRCNWNTHETDPALKRYPERMQSWSSRSGSIQTTAGYYKDIVTEAPALMESLGGIHPFIDGNKRIAFTAVDVFLLINGWHMQRLPMQIRAEMIQMFQSYNFDIGHTVSCLRSFAKASKS